MVLKYGGSENSGLGLGSQTAWHNTSLAQYNLEQWFLCQAFGSKVCPKCHIYEAMVNMVNLGRPNWGTHPSNLGGPIGKPLPTNPTIHPTNQDGKPPLGQQTSLENCPRKLQEQTLANHIKPWQTINKPLASWWQTTWWTAPKRWWTQANQVGKLAAVPLVNLGKPCWTCKPCMVNLSKPWWTLMVNPNCVAIPHFATLLLPNLGLDLPLLANQP